MFHAVCVASSTKLNEGMLDQMWAMLLTIQIKQYLIIYKDISKCEMGSDFKDMTMDWHRWMWYLLTRPNVVTDEH